MMSLISLLKCAKFEGNPIIRLHFMVFFCKCAKREEKERKKEKKKNEMSNFSRIIFQERLEQFTSDLVCVLSQYAGTCTTNLVLFGQEIMEL